MSEYPCETVCMSELPVLDEPKEHWPATLLVRFGQTNQVGEFRNAPGLRPLCGSKVIIQTERGMELGEVISLACVDCGRAVPRDKVAQYVRASGPENCEPNAGKVLRQANKSDCDEAAHIARSSHEMKQYCQARAAELQLDMRVVGVEHVFGGERAIFYFQSEKRVDFRNLVKDLANQYQTRIEMRQIGARDEARLLADYEICGRECCCRNFLKNLKPVNMRMAKTQKATLDPTKVSGRCGRLRCCLRYESLTYDQLEKTLPPMNSRVRIEQGVGKVVDRQILTQLVVLFMEGEPARVVVPVEAILERGVKTPPVTMAPPPERGGRRERPRRDPDAKPRKLIDEAGFGDAPGGSADATAQGAPTDAEEMEPVDTGGSADGLTLQDQPGQQGQAGQQGPPRVPGQPSPPGQGRRRRRRRRGRGGGGGQNAQGEQGAPGQGGPPPPPSAPPPAGA